MPRVARCHATMNAAKIRMETSAARKFSERFMARLLPAASLRPLDGKALDVVFGLGRIEGLAHHREALRRGGRRRQPDLLHQLGGVGGEEYLLGHAGIIDVALDLTPTLHLGHDPDRERFPRERVKIDAVWHLLDAAETVRVGTGQD